MARKNIVECDRCGRECKDRRGRVSVRRISVDNKPVDLCPLCGGAFNSWLRKDNATTPGDSVEWEEVCTHTIPCGGPCNSGTYRRRR